MQGTFKNHKQMFRDRATMGRTKERLCSGTVFNMKSMQNNGVQLHSDYGCIVYFCIKITDECSHDFNSSTLQTLSEMKISIFKSISHWSENSFQFLWPEVLKLLFFRKVVSVEHLVCPGDSRASRGIMLTSWVWSEEEVWPHLRFSVINMYSAQSSTC